MTSADTLQYFQIQKIKIVQLATGSIGVKFHFVQKFRSLNTINKINLVSGEQGDRVLTLPEIPDR